MAVIAVDPKTVRPLLESGAVVLQLNAAEEIVLGQLVYISDNDTVSVASADDADTVVSRLGMAVTNGTDQYGTVVPAGGRLGVCVMGPIYIGEPVDPDPGMIPNTLVYAGSDGAIDTAAGATTRMVGNVQNYAVLFFSSDSSSY